MENIHTLQMIHTALADLKRAGVSDAAASDVFDFSESKIEENKPLVMQVSQNTQVDRAQQTQKVVQKTAAQLDVKKEKVPPFAVEDFVWQVGEGMDVMVLISTSHNKGEVPLSPQAATLFEKMLNSIGLASEKVSFIAVKDEDVQGKPHKSANAKKISEKVHALLEEDSSKQILLVGQSCSKILFNESLSALRKKDVEVTEKPVVALAHPNMLLKQPALKRMAWQDLLKFKTLLEGNH